MDLIFAKVCVGSFFNLFLSLPLAHGILSAQKNTVGTIINNHIGFVDSNNKSEAITNEIDVNFKFPNKNTLIPSQNKNRKEPDPGYENLGFYAGNF